MNYPPPITHHKCFIADSLETSARSEVRLGSLPSNEDETVPVGIWCFVLFSMIVAHFGSLDVGRDSKDLHDSGLCLDG
ncbi:uncharacterized protein LY89DRAFT_688067 [Mollisia scopiformis]|uniref:Uncharacterized protein n=1 Tax=Mollisia scopiformis TaxID=149040 RepID=A0A194WWG2_MOLSC|nr:uncharacterized protein LY89DRAFT_688067 [Mollisia scopiformis]KUJ12316.1 hypothetical protein LY89DRAFT_688067 [Mollisia scopiformis]